MSVLQCRMGLFNCCLAFSALFQPAVQTSAVTYSTVAKPVSAVLIDLSKQLNRHFAADDVIGRQPIVVSVNSAGSADFLNRLAKVCYAKWTTNGDVELLTIDHDAVATEEARQAGQRAAAIDEMIKSDLKTIDQDGPLTRKGATAYLAGRRPTDPDIPWTGNDYQENISQVIEQQRPEKRALDRLLAALGGKEIGPIRDRAVFSSVPTKSERPLPDAAAAILKQYFQERNVWVKAWRAIGAVNMHTVGAPNPAAPDKYKLSDSGSPYKMLLIVTRPRLGTYFSLQILDKSDQIVGVAKSNFYPDDASFEDIGSTNLKIEFSTDSKWIATQESRMHSDNMPAIEKPPEGLASKLRHPEIFDPLSWNTSEMLIGLSKNKGEQLIAMLTDADPMWFDEDPTSQGAERAIGWAGDLRLSDKGGWIEVWPKDPSAILVRRADRTAIAQLISSAVEGRIALQEKIAYFTKHRKEEGACTFRQLQLLGISLFEKLSRNLPMQVLAFNDSPSKYAFYGMLSSSILDLLKSGGSVKVGDLSAEAQEMLVHLIYLDDGRQPIFHTHGPRKPEAVIPMTPEVDPDEAMPDGVPLDGVVTMTDKLSSRTFRIDWPIGLTCEFTLTANGPLK